MHVATAFCGAYCRSYRLWLPCLSDSKARVLGRELLTASIWNFLIGGQTIQSFSEFMSALYKMHIAT